MDYVDFSIRLGPRVGENQYHITVRSPMGDAAGIFTPPFSREQLELFVLKMGMRSSGVRGIRSEKWNAAQEFGAALFRAVLNQDARAAYLASLNDATRQGKGLRLRLAPEDPALANYPWEFLYDPHQARFVALFDETPLVRTVELGRTLAPLALAAPLRIIAVGASPRAYEALDLARERANLDRALQELYRQSLVKLDWLPRADLGALQTQLLQRTYHIFHFVGHGGFDAARGDGFLVFEDDAQRANPVSGERLAIILGSARTIRLAVLNACEGARTSEQDPFAGAAMTLLRTGNLPAVLAMQFPITDEAAIEFANGFYTSVATGRPIDEAVSAGRKQIFANDNDIEWSTPVLYLRAADGKIFDLSATPILTPSRAPMGMPEAARTPQRAPIPSAPPDAVASRGSRSMKWLIVAAVGAALLLASFGIGSLVLSKLFPPSPTATLGAFVFASPTTSAEPVVATATRAATAPPTIIPTATRALPNATAPPPATHVPPPSAPPTVAPTAPHAAPLNNPYGGPLYGETQTLLTIASGAQQTIKVQDKWVGPVDAGPPSCAQGYMTFTWIVRSPYPFGGEDLVVKDLIPQGGGQERTIGSGATGEGVTGYCNQITLTNNSLFEYRVELRYAFGLLQ